MEKADTDSTAAIYCRISRDPEGERFGVARQEDLCRELAARLNLEVVAVFVDNDTGASDRTHKSKVRPQFAAMLEEAEQGKFRFIVAYSNSRLTRRMAELEDLIKLHDTTGVKFHTVVSGQDDLSTADGRMVARIKASVDAAESDRVSERQKAAFRQRALKGEPKLQRQRPFGWKADGKTLDETEAALVREGVADLIRGMSIDTIRKRWEKAGVLTAAGNEKWAWTTVKNVLTGWRTAGVRTYHREPLLDTDGNLVMGTWEPIITLEEREAALAQLRKRGLVKQRSGKWLLSGIVRCGECGGPMYGNLSHGRTPDTYVCKDGSGHVAIDADKLQQHVLLEFYTHLTNRQIRGTGELPPPKVAEWEGAARLEVVVAKKAELLDAYNSDVLSGSVVFPQLSKLDAEQKELLRSRDAHYAASAEPERSVRSGKDALRFLQEVDGMTFEEKRTVMRQEIEAVVVRKGVRGPQARTADALRERVRISWKHEVAPFVEPKPMTFEDERQALLDALPNDVW